jgi:hypothetical protein
LYTLQLVDTLTGGLSRLWLGTQVFGAWLGYLNLLALVSETGFDLAFGVPPSGGCR